MSAKRRKPEGTYVAIAGNIGAGKSSFVEFLERHYAIEPVFEPNDSNPFLESFYEDMPRWAFHSQLYFLAKKLEIHRNIANSRHDIIQDRTLWEDAEIFARHLAETGVMSAREWDTYRLLYEAVRDQLRRPDVLIYLRCPVRTLRKRIAHRGRAMEREIPAPYLQALHKSYDRWFDSYDLSPKVVFETDKIDPVTDLVDCHDVMAIIDQYL